jgi:HlyD family secretion protein
MAKKKRNILLIIGLAMAFVTLLIILGKEVIGDNTYTVQRGEFESSIISKGEMKSQSYIKINMPEVMTDPSLNIYYLKINDLVAEGTLVDKGDYVALLDQERIKGELNNSQEKLENYINNLNMRQIDSTSDLTDKRNKIQEMYYDLEYKEIEIKQSVYESLSYQNKKKREYSISKRKLDMAERDYQRSFIHHSDKCSYSERRVKEYTERVEKLEEAVIAANITAPQDGMIIYATARGKTREKGDYVAFWSPEIAVLPDLTKLISEGYIEEIDISKVEKGYPVRVRVDALPDKVFEGNLLKIANIGKSVKGVDSKVFDITVKITGADKDIAHGMSTTNEIITHSDDNALLVPLEYIFTNDSGSIVYKKLDGEFIESPISFTYSNDKVVKIEDGLNEGDIITDQITENK